MFTTNEDIQISLSPVNGLAVPSEQVEMVESPSSSSGAVPALGLGALFAGLWRIVSWYNRDATVETDDSDIFNSDDIGLNWLMQELESSNEEDSNSIQGEDEQAPVDSDMHPCNDNDMQANNAEDENDERWEEIKEQFLGGLEQYLQDIKTNRENSTNSSEGNSLREDHSTDQISEDDLSLDLDMTVQSAEFGHSTHTVTLRSLRPSEEHQKTSSTLREAGDGESEEDQ